ncbi:MAG: long-chain fatty acid--CoA ligase [Proteobacteria bacterium]|nr:long-chain fatty acid--CoA ligase [Pseudomonadota bacterium]
MRDNSTILHRLRNWAKDQPTSEALHYREDESGWGVISASVYWRQVVRFAVALRDSGINRGDRVVIHAQNSPEWVQWELAIWLAGGISVGVHPHTSELELQKMISQTSPKLILVESEAHRGRIPEFGIDPDILLGFDEIFDRMPGVRAYSAEELDLRGDAFLGVIDPSATSMIIFTSGTTGTPKGVMMGLSQLTFVAEILSREWRLPFMDGRLFSFLPLAHVAEKVQTLAVAILQRYPVWFNSHYDRLLPELKEVRPSLLLAVPRIWERFREQAESQKPKLFQRVMEFERIGKLAEKVYLNQVREQLGLDQLKVAVSGAAKLPPAIGEWFERIGIQIQEIYGMSESCGLISLTHPPRSEYRSVGKVPAGVEVRIAMDGEILVRGPNVFSGYWGNPDATAEVLLPEGWLKTGDLGELTPDLHIIGRNRDIIKLSSGRMVAPLPIENALKEIPEVSNACVVGEGKASILALITLKEQILVDLRFLPGAIEGLTVEDEALKGRIKTGIRSLIEAKKLAEPVTRFVILSRDFSIDQKELTQTQKINRSRIQQAFRHFIDLQFEV